MENFRRQSYSEYIFKFFRPTTATLSRRIWLCDPSIDRKLTKDYKNVYVQNFKNQNNYISYVTFDFYRYFRSLDIKSANHCKNENFRFQTRFMGFSGCNEGLESIKLTFWRI
jgi:hypothetical protein